MPSILHLRWVLPPRIRCPAIAARALPILCAWTIGTRTQPYANRSAYDVVVALPPGLLGLLLRLRGHLPCPHRSPAARLPLRLPSQTRKAAYRTSLSTRTLVPSRPASRIPSHDPILLGSACSLPPPPQPIREHRPSGALPSESHYTPLHGATRTLRHG